MRAYIIRRLLLVIPTLFILSILVFLAVRFIPGNVIDLLVRDLEYLGAFDFGQYEAIEANREALEHFLGLDVPAYVQYGRWLGGYFPARHPWHITVGRFWR